MSYGYLDKYACSGLFRYKMSQCTKTYKNDYPPIEDSIQRKRQHSLINLRRALGAKQPEFLRAATKTMIRLIFAGHM